MYNRIHAYCSYCFRKNKSFSSSRKELWRRQWHSTPVLLPRKLNRWRSLVSYSPWDCRVTHDWATSQCPWPSGSFPSECFGDPAYFCLVVLLAASSELSPCSLQIGKETVVKTHPFLKCLSSSFLLISHWHSLATWQELQVAGGAGVVVSGRCSFWPDSRLPMIMPLYEGGTVNVEWGAIHLCLSIS